MTSGRVAGLLAMGMLLLLTTVAVLGIRLLIVGWFLDSTMLIVVAAVGLGACSHTLTVDAGVVCSRGLADGGTSKSTLVCSSRHHGGSSSDGVSCSHFAGEDYRTTGWAFCSHGSSGHLDGDMWREGIVTCGMASRVRFSNTHWCEILTWDHGQWDTQP